MAVLVLPYDLTEKEVEDILKGLEDIKAGRTYTTEELNKVLKLD